MGIRDSLHGEEPVKDGPGGGGCVTTERAQALLAADEHDLICVKCEEWQAVTLCAADIARLDHAERDAVTVIAPNANARRAITRALDECGVNAGDVSTTAIQALALSICRNAPEKRDLEVLDPVQQVFFFEDMKVLGLKPRRLREIMKFLCRGITEFSYRDDDWLINDQERTILAHMRMLLEERGGILPSMCGAAACEVLEDVRIYEARRMSRVYAIGFSSYDKASQHLVTLLADKIVAFGSKDDPGVEAISFPHAEGFAQLADNPSSSVLHVAPPKQRTEERVMCANPDEEAELIVRRIEQSTRNGSSITIATPSGRWAKRVLSRLDARGLPASIIEKPARLTRDVREKNPGDFALLYGALGVAAYPKSMLYLRTWVGLGDWLGASTAWDEARSASKERGLSLLQYLSCLMCEESANDATASENLRFLGERLREARAIAESCSSLRGADFACAIERAVDREGAFAASHIAVAPDDSAQSLLARMRASLADPTVADGVSVVVASCDQAAWALADEVVFAGAVDGLIPPSDACDESAPPDLRAKQLSRDRIRLARALRLGRTRTLVTSFMHMGLVEASQEKADIKRIYVSGGKRLARVAPTCLLAWPDSSADASTSSPSTSSLATPAT